MDNFYTSKEKKLPGNGSIDNVLTEFKKDFESINETVGKMATSGIDERVWRIWRVWRTWSMAQRVWRLPLQSEEATSVPATTDGSVVCVQQFNILADHLSASSFDIPGIFTYTYAYFLPPLPRFPSFLSSLLSVYSSVRLSV